MTEIKSPGEHLNVVAAAEKSAAVPDTIDTEQRELLEVRNEAVGVRAGVEFLKNSVVGEGRGDVREVAEEAAYFAQENLDALQAAMHEGVSAPEMTRERDKKSDSIWSGETRQIAIDSIEVTLPEHFAEHISQYLSVLQLPRRLYAGDRVAPIKPIDVLAATAERLGVRGKKIIFEIGEAPYTDISEDGESLVVCLSKFRLTNPRMGLLGTLALETKNLLLNRGNSAVTKMVRDDIAAQTTHYVFDRARYGEALGYQIPPEHQQAYYRGVDYESLNLVAAAGGFVGRNSDSLIARLDPTVWAYTDPGMAESFGCRGTGVVFRLKKQEVDAAFATKPGWQRWTVNEVMIQAKEEANEVLVSLGNYVDHVLVFDDAGQALVAALFPDIPQVVIRTVEDGERYLIDNGEMTNDELEQFYDAPDRLADYIGQAEDNPIFTMCQIDKESSYDVCREKMKAKKLELEDHIFRILGLENPADRRYAGGILSLNEVIRNIHENRFYQLPPIVKQIIDQNPDVVDDMETSYGWIYSITELLSNFDSYQTVREAADQFKQKT